MREGLPFALGASIRNPFSRDILRYCVLAQRPVSLDELAESMDGLRSTIRDHAEEMAMLGALKVSEELWPWRPASHRYEVTGRLMESTWALTGLGLMPGDRWGLPDEQAEKINEHIADRRKDKEFTERLRRRMEEDRDVLEALAGPDVPVRLWRRARAWLRSVSTQRLKTRRRPKPLP
jgi:hypothetical protein